MTVAARVPCGPAKTVAAAAGVAALAGGLICGPRDALQAYVAAAIAFVSIPLGALVLLFMMDVTGGTWRDLLGPAARSMKALLPVAALLFVPVLGGMFVGLWSGPPGADWTPFKRIYLQSWFLGARTIGYFALWIWLSLPRGQRSGAEGAGAAALIALTITLTLASVDWSMALEREFSSSIYGLIFLTHATLAGLSGMLILYGRAHDSPHPMLGALLVTVLLLWAYMHAMQFIILWAGNRPEDAAWYIARSQGLWLAALWVISLFGLVLPFAALLSPKHRAAPASVATIATIVLATSVLESFWLVIPGHGERVLPASLGALGGLLLCGSLASMRPWSKREVVS